MVAPKRLSIGAEENDFGFLECEELSSLVGDGACRETLLGICRRERKGEQSTVWDIHRLTGLALHEAFAALRTLEYGKIIDIVDNPADPFGAVIRLRKNGLDNLRRQSAT